MLGAERRQKIEATAARIRELLADIERTTTRMGELVDQDEEEEVDAV